jgi:hypothetical protein
MSWSTLLARDARSKLEQSDEVSEGFNMASPVQVETLLEAVKKLPPDKLAQFTASFTEWHESSEALTDDFLIQQTKLSLRAVEQRRLATLAAKSERQELTADGLREFRALSQRAERINGTRVSALAELALRWNQPIQQVMTEIGWREPEHGR